jgi:cysteine desulfurase
VHRARVDGNGVVSLEDVRAAANTGTALVTVMHSNNETGVLQPIADLARVAHDVGALMHTDAAQSLGKVPVSVRQLGVDLLSVAGHKLYAPKGVGALFIRRGVEVSPLVLGAGHERGIRPGTENVASIVGLGAACALAQRTLDAEAQRVRQLRDLLWNLLAAGVPGLALNGHAQLRLPNTLNVRFPRVGGTALLDATPQVEASTGSACHDGHEAASAVILAMGVPERDAAGSVRLTLGRGTDREQVERAAAALVAGWRQCSAAE